MLTGPTGAGKSTISNLIHRFYDTNKGKVILGGVEIRKLTQEYIGKKVGMVLQDPFLFSGSILDNLKYGNPNINIYEIEEAVKLLGIEEFVETLPKGHASSKITSLFVFLTDSIIVIISKGLTVLKSIISIS